MSKDWIVVSGAREHNLKNVDVKIPRDKLTVITGLSGSGKSSLAFDTIYAEGQRKYVESLSAYARQFLEQMQKPNVDFIEGLSPAISIEQRTAGSNPRSVVATTTEIHDYLRLLYASVGKRHCWKCSRPVERQSAELICEQLLAMPEKTRLMILAPLVNGKKGEHLEVIEGARKQGLVRLRVDGEIVDIDSVPKLNKKTKHSIDAVVDRLAVKSDIRGRMNDSVELALRIGEGILTALVEGEKKGEWDEQLYSEKAACLHCGISFEEMSPRHFSFNSPYGACSSCAGLGALEVMEAERVVPDVEKTLANGAIAPWRRGGPRTVRWYKKLLTAICDAAGIDMKTPWIDLPIEDQMLLLYGSDEPMEFSLYHARRKIDYERPWEGVLENLNEWFHNTESDSTRSRLREYMGRSPCSKCKGARLKPASLSCTVAEKNVAEITELSIRDAYAFFEGVTLEEQEAAIASEVVKEIQARLRFLNNVGLDYLTLDRESGTLSGGEAQRIRLATQIGSGLVGVVYVLDEPSIGLHQRDNRRLIETLKGLRDAGNTVLVVEHDEDTIREADHVLDIGPGAGVHGGEIVFSGVVSKLLKSKKSLTAKYLNGDKAIPIPEKRLKPTKGLELTIKGAAANNLKKVNARFPLGLFICVTGVSGSGKSTLVTNILKRSLFKHFHDSKERPGTHKSVEGMEHLDKAIVIDQAPIGRTPRSNPATYTGAFTQIRELFTRLPKSKLRGYKPGRFSFNVKGGRCETCQGDGMLKIEMHFLPDVYVPCKQCAGRRYNAETLEVLYKGNSIADVLEMTIEESLTFFDAIPGIQRKFQTLYDVGLGYLRLGQPATTLSGGEAQRVKLSSELSKRNTGKTLYILDEPTTGLHFEDVRKLMEVLMRLRDSGSTLVIIEHNLDVIKMADWIIDLGPEGGDAGGKILVQGTPEKVAKTKASHTGTFLKDMLGS